MIVPELTYKQRMFVHYFTGESNGNATDAARKAGYRTPGEQGRQILRIPWVSAAIKSRTANIALSSDEVLARLAEQATSSYGELIDIDDNGNVTFNFKRAKKLKKLHLIKKMRQGRHGWEVEFHDAQAALQLLGKYHNLFNDRPPAPEQGKDYPELINVMDAPPRNGTANGNGHL